MIPVRLAAAKAMSHVLPAVLADHTPALIRMLKEDQEWGVRKWAAVALGELDRTSLAPHAATMAAQLLVLQGGTAREHPDVRYALLRALCSLEAAELDAHAAAIADPLNLLDDGGLEGLDDELFFGASTTFKLNVINYIASKRATGSLF